MQKIRLFTTNVSLIIGGLVLIALGLSQAIFGWVSDGIFARILYGVVGTGLGLAVFIGGCYSLWLQFFPHHNTEPDENIDEITLTTGAAKAARRFMPDFLMPLRVSAQQLDGGGYHYSLKIESKAPLPSDLKIRQRGLELLIDQSLVPLFSGTTIDFEESENGKGFRFDNPNAGQTLAEATTNYNNAKNRGPSTAASRTMIAGIALLLMAIVGSVGAGVWFVGSEFTRNPAQVAREDEQFKKNLSPERYRMLYGRLPDPTPKTDSLAKPTKVESTRSKPVMEPKGQTQPMQPLPNARPIKPATRGEGAKKLSKTPIGTDAPIERISSTPEQAAPHRKSDDVPTLEVGSELPKNQRSINILELTPDGQHAIIGNDASDLEVFDLVANQKVFSTKRLGLGSLTTILISLDSRTVVSGYHYGDIVIWDLKDSGKLTQRLKLKNENKKPIQSLAIQPAGRLLAAGEEGLTVWDLETQEVIFSDQLQKPVTSCQFLDDGQIVAFSDGRSAKSVSISDKQTRSSIEINGKGLACPSAISSDGKFLLSATGMEIQLTSLQTGESVGTFDTLAGANFSADGKHFLTYWNNEILVWSSSKLVCLAKIEIESLRNNPAGVSAGQIIVVTDRKKLLKRYQFAPSP